MRGSLGEFREASIHDLSSVPEAPELGSLSSSSPHHVHQQQRQTQGLKFTRFASPRSASDGLLPQDTYDAGSSKQIASVEKTSRRRSAPSTKNERAANDSDSKDQHYQQPTRKRSSESPRKPSSESSVKRLATSYSTRRLKKKSPTRIIAEDFDEDDEDGNNPAQNEDEIQDHDDTKWGLLLTAFGLDFEDGCCPCRRPGYNRVSSYIVRHAPCFWFCGRSFDVGATDRSILYRLNLLCGFFAFGQIASAVLLAILFYSRSIVDRDDDSVNRRETNAGSLTPNLWNLNGNIFMVGVLAIVIFTTMILTLKVIREVNLRGAIRYMWIMVWILPLQIFLVISLYDYHRVTEVWVEHWWSLPVMAYFRQLFCAEGTANSLCIVPVGGGVLFSNETEWCDTLYGATNCTSIRDEAQQDMLTFSYLFYHVNAGWGLLLLLLLVLTINVLEGIITKPIVQQSRESNVPVLLTFPIVGCSAVGAIFLFSPSSGLSSIHSESDNAWVGMLYIVCGATFFIAALLGWFISSFSILNNGDKRNKMIAVVCFIGIISVTLLLVDEERGQAACVIDSAMSCSLCGNRLGFQQCPEWTSGEVIKVVQTQLKQSATLAAIFLLYSMSALRFGFVLKKHISMYQIDYV